MADEVRRSGRATKGQHTKNIEIPDVNTPKRGGKNNRSKASKQTSTEASPPAEEADDAIIRCICGYVEEDEDDDRVMVICDNCQAWQHNECMEISEDQDELPEHYYCEQCRPEDHKELLAKIVRGEKPWEERANQREIEEAEKKARKRKGGKKGKKGKLSDAKPEKTEDVNVNGDGNGNRTPVKVVPAADITANIKPETGQKRKLQSDGTPELKATDEQEPSNKVRKVSASKDMKAAPQKRKSSAMAAPERRDSKGVVLQTELVENVSELQSEVRKRSATALVALFVEQTKNAEKQGTFKLPPGQPIEAFGLRLGLAVEYAMYLNFWGHTGEPTTEYRQKLLSILHNVKANPALRDRLLNGSLPPNDFTKMSSDDMASKELQEKTAEMRKEVEKQHMLIQEEGPRIRRTHKGEEFIDDGSQHIAGTEPIYANVPARRRESEMDLDALKHTSPAPTSPQSPNVVELPNDVSYSGTLVSPTSGRSLSIDTRAPPRPPVGLDKKTSSAFNIQNVWSSVDSPETDQQRIRPLPQRQVSENVQESPSGLGVEVDADIDHLLKDEEPEDDEPYSPTDYPADPGTIWRGKMVMASVAEFSGTAKHVAGANLSGAYPWPQLMPHALSIEGRISIDRASEYLCGLRWSKTTDLTVVAITPNDEPDTQAQFNKLFNYFTERKRYGVVGKSPVSAVRDIYVVPLESGMGKKPEFIELLEYCTIEDPCPERMLLVTYVIKSKTDPTSSAQATPRHLDTATAASPLSTQHAQGQFRPPIPVGHPGSHMSPLQPYTGTASYGSPAQHQQSFMPPQQQHSYSPPPYTGNPVGIDAARQVLGDMANSPAVGELLSQAPNTGVVEFGIIKEFFESVPACRNDFGMLMGLLKMKSQQNGGAV